MCPGNDESAGKRESGKTRKGKPGLRTALVEAAHAAAATKGTYSGRPVPPPGRPGAASKRAVVAVGHTILVSRLPPAARRHGYEDLGANYFDERDRQAVERRLVRRLEALGHKVTLEPAA